MSETPFFKTRMGHRFYEHTMPALVKQIETLNALLGQLIESKGSVAGSPTDEVGD